MAQVSLRQQGDTWILTDEGPESTEPIVWNAEGRDYAILEAFVELVSQTTHWQTPEVALTPETVWNWCKRYGLPRVERREPGTSKPCLTVDSFNWHLTHVRDACRMWIAIVNKDRGTLREFIPHYLGINASYLDKYDLSQLCDTGLQALARYLDILTRGQLSLVPVFTQTGGLALQYQAQTLWSLAMLQLETLCVEEKRQRLLECQACHRLFVGHANRKYCCHCDRKTIHSRKKRHAQRLDRSV